MRTEYADEGGFHAKGGFYFKRAKNGDVLIASRPPEPFGNKFSDVRLDPATWASVVASLTERGDTAETFRAVMEFYNDNAK